MVGWDHLTDLQLERYTSSTIIRGWLNPNVWVNGAQKVLLCLNKRNWPLIVVSERVTPLTYASEIWTVENRPKSVNFFSIFWNIDFRSKFLSQKRFGLMSWNFWKKIFFLGRTPLPLQRGISKILGPFVRKNSKS